MPTIVTTLNGTCESHGGSGSHLDFTLSVDGQSVQWRGVDVSEVLAPITDDDKFVLLRIILKLVKQGRTLAQARTLLTNGVSVTI